MKITVIGTGYVGLVSGVCFANIGHKVVCVDKSFEKISILSKGEVPIYEPDLKEVLQKVLRDDKISFTNNLKDAIAESDAIFIAVGTPQGEDGSADLSYVLSAAKEIAEFSNCQKLIITKSTVPAGTGSKIKELLKKINPNVNFLIASNPEFLREGCAVNDFMNPDRIVIGCEDEESKKILGKIYEYFDLERIFYTDIITAELIKYASNSFLATKIAFINEIADLCESTGANIKHLSKALGKDSRIGEKFLNPGPGFGGSCFPKDILSILNIAKENKVELSLISSVINSNQNRYQKMVGKILRALDFKHNNKTIGLLGLSFKANTDDIRYSPAIKIAKELATKNVVVKAHDFEAIENSKYELKDFDNIKFYHDVYQAIENVDLIVIATEWNKYIEIDFSRIKQLTKCRKIVDLRNIFDEKYVKDNGFEYVFIGSKESKDSNIQSNLQKV